LCARNPPHVFPFIFIFPCSYRIFFHLLFFSFFIYFKTFFCPSLLVFFFFFLFFFFKKNIVCYLFLILVCWVMSAKLCSIWWIDYLFYITVDWIDISCLIFCFFANFEGGINILCLKPTEFMILVVYLLLFIYFSWCVFNLSNYVKYLRTKFLCVSYKISSYYLYITRWSSIFSLRICFWYGLRSS